jgi:hypothetical protein
MHIGHAAGALAQGHQRPRFHIADPAPDLAIRIDVLTVFQNGKLVLRVHFLYYSDDMKMNYLTELTYDN